MKKDKMLFIAPLLVVTTAIICAAGSVSSQSQSRWYAGYKYFGYSEEAPWGVYARIYTIDPYVPYYEVHFQWDTIVLSYEKGYWLQLGYHKYPPYHGLIFYYEVVDSDEVTHANIRESPTIGATYRYTIVHAGRADPKLWKFYIRNEACDTIFSREVSASPYEPRDLQAFAETTTSSVKIDGTHFSQLRYFEGRDWPLWDRHKPRVDHPYWLNEVAHYEFKAGGGG